MSSKKMKAYIVRIWKDNSGRVGGHVSDPLTEERLVFQGWTELRQILSAGVAAPSEIAVETDIILPDSGREKNDV